MSRRRDCPIKKVDPGTCVDFSTKGTLVTDAYRRGWDLWQKGKRKMVDSELKKK